ncbi:MAG: dienelactone hydrolase family protein [Terriglobales bacterium]
METNWVNLTVSDGTTMAAFTVQPDAPSRRGVLVLQEAFGVNGYIQDVAQRLAKLGYRAIAPDLFHRSVERFQGDYADFRPALGYMKAMNYESTAADVRACHDWLASQAATEVGAIGFCMGGRVAMLAAQVLPLQAAVSFYGGNLLSLREHVAETQAPVLLVWGDRDEHIPREQRAEFAGLLRAAHKSFVECTFGDAGHAFFNNERSSGYVPEAARLAWPLATAFLSRG